MDELRVVGITDLKANFSAHAREVAETGRDLTVFKNNRPYVVLAPYRQGGGEGDVSRNPPRVELDAGCYVSNDMHILSRKKEERRAES